ncbi:drug resistance transporter, EmrB/QacA subfamily [Marinomonas polaris DSM 16579]|uniref:Drug resistance transporter, EmrB/QacA subfamily n=1 Tax=Marinomonas polaris DSM 16579 TaxID=1122206 RepID=A0A1M4XFS7_9GAMM|nr:MFS transporter [Marinomonas polaris]SHE92032.1 drug resistance transporter, EmrB/QacA subfamily [Marinomonas polaris DSM 16579]
MRTSASRNKIALMAICLSAIMLGLEITSVPSVLPVLKDILPADFKQLQWIMNAYTLAMCSVLVAMGALADRFGRKRVFTIGIIVFGVASLICSLATNAPILIAARFLQGISAAAMLACQVAILSNQFQNGPERGVAFAWWGIVFGLGLGFGPIVGGLIIAHLSWEWVFLIHVFIAVITLVLARIGVLESSDPDSLRVDYGGMITLSSTVFGLVFMITQGQSIGYQSLEGILIIGASALAFVLFLIIESKVARPMFDLKAFRIRNFSGALFGAAGMNFSFWPFVVYFPIYLQSVLGYDGITAGLTVLALTLPTIVVPPYAEKILIKHGPKFLISLGLTCISGGFFLLWAIASSPEASWLTLMPGCILAGIGLGFTNTPVTNTATGSLPPERAGMASGMEFSARMISLSLNIALMGLILANGIASRLLDLLPKTLSETRLIEITDILASGNLNILENYGISKEIAKNILMEGFSSVLLYGATSTAVICFLAFITFERKILKI